MILFSSLPLAFLCLLDAVTAQVFFPTPRAADRRRAPMPRFGERAKLARRDVAVNASKTIVSLGLSEDGRWVLCLQLLYTTFSPQEQ